MSPVLAGPIARPDETHSRTDLFIVEVSGGRIRRLTHDDARETNPEWSRDGHWIYYGSAKSGRSEIWKIPAEGGAPSQVTTRGGAEPHESPDGTAICFIEPLTNPYATTTLLRIATTGGSITPVLSEVWPGAWDVTDQGIVFLTGRAGSRRRRQG